MRTSTASTCTSVDGIGGALAAPSALGVGAPPLALGAGSTATMRDSPCGVGLWSARKSAKMSKCQAQQ